MDEVHDARKRSGFAIVLRDELGEVSRRAGHRAALLWVALATFAHQARGDVWPLQSTLCAQLGVSDRWVRRRLVELEDAGVLQCTWKVKRAGRFRVYTLLDFVIHPPR